MTMPATSAAHELEDPEVGASPFRAAFDRARVEALVGPGSLREPLRVDSEAVQQFEYRLEKRSGKRSADVADWNALGRHGWELVGVTRKHAAFKRPLGSNLSR
jgi:hypothetical protein